MNILARTRGKIPRLFPESLESDSLLVLASSLYFKSVWKHRFRYPLKLFLKHYF